jgi:hypothetical protein
VRSECAGCDDYVSCTGSVVHAVLGPVVNDGGAEGKKMNVQYVRVLEDIIAIDCVYVVLYCITDRRVKECHTPGGMFISHSNTSCSQRTQNFKANP